MPIFNVTADFYDKNTDELITAGSEIEVDDDERIESLKAARVIGKEVQSGDEVIGLKNLGGGYYELPNGEKVRGKENALKALSALEEGDPDAQNQTGDTSGDGTGDEGAGQGSAAD